jgi:type I restriction enzyme S subunit
MVSPQDLESLRYIGLEHIDSGEIGIRRWGDSAELKSAKTAFQPGDVLYGKLRPYLDKAVLAPWRGLCSTELLALEIDRTAAVPEYLVCVVHSKPFVQHAVDTTGGTNLPRTSWNSLREFMFALPPLPEQRAIARVLRTVQRAKEATEKVIAATKQLKQSLMRHLFTYGPVPVDEAEKVELKETDAGMAPSLWRSGRVDEFVKLQRGYDLPSQDRRPGNVPVVSSSGVTGQHSEAKVTGPGVVTGRYGTLGSVYYIEGDFWPLNTTLFVKEFKSCDPEFVSHFLRTLNLQSFNDKTSIPGVNRNHVHAMKVAVPPLREQRTIASLLRASDLKLETEGKLMLAEDGLFNSLLHHLMTGKVQVHDLGLSLPVDVA